MKKIIHTFISALVAFLCWFFLLKIIFIINKDNIRFSNAFLSMYFIFGWIIITLTLYLLSKKYQKMNNWLHSLLNKLMAFSLAAIFWSLLVKIILLVDGGNIIALFISPIIIFGWIIYFVITVILYSYINKINVTCMIKTDQ